MTSATPERPPGTPKTMPLQGLVNRIMNRVLTSPLAGGPGRSILLMHVVGRKTGKRYDIPVTYTRHEDYLLVGASFGWNRNLRTGDVIEIHHLGNLRTADVEAHADEETVVADYAVICRANKQFAGFNNIGFDAAGHPNPSDLRAAWANGVRSIRLRLR